MLMEVQWRWCIPLMDDEMAAVRFGQGQSHCQEVSLEFSQDKLRMKENGNI